MLVTSKIFGLILTSCVMTENGTDECQDFILDSSNSMQKCVMQMDKKLTSITEMELLSCEEIKDYKHDN